MVSETVTGGQRPILMRVEHKKGVKNILQKMTASLVNAGAVDPKLLWGIPKFDMVFEHFSRHGALIEFEEWFIERNSHLSSDIESDMREDFNEAKRAALWIAENWN